MDERVDSTRYAVTTLAATRELQSAAYTRRRNASYGQ